MSHCVISRGASKICANKVKRIKFCPDFLGEDFSSLSDKAIYEALHYSLQSQEDNGLIYVRVLAEHAI